ncbi:MAG: UDP-N-acetylmuramate dehydrogenase [Bacteroidetes bacterium]|nr:UDP-N-acetylmuramate dehydrogenase [Bacteroidota bacterium]
MNIINYRNLKPYNTFGINVDAKRFVEVASLAEIQEVREYLRLHPQNFLVLGGGSNVLFTKDFDGLVIRINLSGIEITGEDKYHVYIKAAAGEEWDGFVEYCTDFGFAGIENLSLIPGCVGASPIQNIGAYGVEMKDHFHSLEYFDLSEGTVRTMLRGNCRFGYRDSIFKHELKAGGIILSVTFRLDKLPVFRTNYGALKDELDRMGISGVTIQKTREAVIAVRHSKLPDPAVVGNAGSFFKNPAVSKERHDQLKSLFPQLVSFPQPDDTYKLAAGWLIEQCGWKGRRIGDAGVHEKQALVLVNYGNAKGAEITDLARQIQISVKEKFSVDLEKEVNIL